MGGTTEAFQWATSIPSAEASFGTAIPLVNLTDWLTINEFNPAKIDKTFRTDQNRIKGSRGVQTRQLATRMGTIPFKADASIEKLVWLLYRGLGNGVPSGASDPFTHTIKHPTLCTREPWSTSLMQGIVCGGLSSGYKLFSGVTLDQFSITHDGDNPLSLEWTEKTDGREVTQGAFTWPSTPVAVNYLLASHVNMKLYPNGGGAIDITNKLMSHKLTYSFNVQRPKVSNGSIYVPRYRYSQGHPKLDLEFVVSGDKSDAIYGYADSETLLTIVLTYDTGLTPARSAELTIAKCYIQVEQTSDDIEPTLNCKVEPIDILADNGPAVWVGKTGVSAYLNPL